MSLRNQIDELFDEAFDRFESAFDFGRGTHLLSGGLPTIDLYEDKDNFVVKAELPGVRKEDIEITLHNGMLSLSGERKQTRETAEPRRLERFAGRFYRTLSLPAKVDSEKISATYKDGILTVALPKAEEAKPKQISVHVK
jgi:HSP20 family protein